MNSGGFGGNGMGMDQVTAAKFELETVTSLYEKMSNWCWKMCVPSVHTVRY